MKKEKENVFFQLVSLGLGFSEGCNVDTCNVDWENLYALACAQGVSALCLDGLQKLLHEAPDLHIDKKLKLQWVALAMKQELCYGSQWKAAKDLSELYDRNSVDTYVMKGFSLSRLYLKPEHRQCTDMDCFLMNKESNQCAYERGNKIAEQCGLKVDRSYYKHSKIGVRGLTVENHQFLLPIKGSGKAKRFESELREWIDDGRNTYIADSKMKATSPFFDAVFVLAHAQEHFFSEGMILRHICDWAMVLNAYAEEVDWEKWKSVCDKYGMLSFGYAMSRLAKRVCGVSIPFDCPIEDKADSRLLDDTLYRKSGANVKRSDMQVRISLVKNMFENSWKYRLFSDTNSLMFCGRRVWGYLFDKDLD